MRIKQCYVSDSVSDFRFKDAMGLEDYYDVTAPTVFYGCYTLSDFMRIACHQGFKVIRWCGQDVLNWHNIDMLRPCHHVTPLRNVHFILLNRLRASGRISLIKTEGIDHGINPMEKGSKIYAYCPSSFPEYHGNFIIDQLKKRYSEIVVGTGEITQTAWHAGRSSRFYDDAFIGLMLSPFAGGGQSVVEMGLQGKKCVTNVLDMPNSISFDNFDNIVRAIEVESKHIGETDERMAQAVYDNIDRNFDWLDTDWY